MISEEVMNFQSTAFEMNMNGLITDREFSILEVITESMTAGDSSLDVLEAITIDDLQDTDIVDCIIAKQFYTALIILGAETTQALGKEVDEKCPW